MTTNSVQSAASGVTANTDWRRLPVRVVSVDPITQAGLVTQLRCRPELWVLDEDQADAAEVAVVAVDEIDSQATLTVRALQQDGVRRVVVIVGRLDDAGLLAAVEAGACGLLRRSEAQPERIAAAATAAAGGDGSLPPDLLGRLLAQVGQLGRQVLSPRGMSLNGLTVRSRCATSPVSQPSARRRSTSDLRGWCPEGQTLPPLPLLALSWRGEVRGITL